MILNSVPAVIFCLCVSVFSAGAETSDTSPAAGSGTNAASGIGLLPPLLTATIEKDLWIGAAMEERFYRAGQFSSGFFIPNSIHLNRSLQDCPLLIPRKCREIVGNNLGLTWMVEIQYESDGSRLSARIVMNHVKNDSLSVTETVETPADDPLRFITAVVTRIFEIFGPLDDVTAAELNAFPTRNLNAYGCYVIGLRKIMREEFKEAFYPLMRAQELDPQYVDPIIEVGRAYLLTGRLEDARKQVSTRISIPYWRMEILKAQVLLKAGKPKASFKALKTAEEIIPGRTAELDFEFGSYYKTISATSRGISYIISAINRNPSVLKYYLTLGDLYAQRGEYGTAIPYYEKLANLDPDNKFYKLNFGIALRESNKINESIEVFENILKEHPDFYPARTNLGITYYQLGWYQKADKAFIANIALRQDTSNSFLNLGVLRMLVGDAKMGKQLITASLTLDPKSIQSLVSLAKVEIAEGSLTDAEIHLQQAIVLGGADTTILLSLAGIYAQLKNPEREYEYLNKALELDPENVTVLTRLARHSMAAQDYVSAVNYLMEIIDFMPSAHAQRMLLAECLLLANDRDAALQQYQYIADNFSHSAEVIMQLGESFFKNRFYSKAVETVEPLLNVGYIEFDARLLLGKCYTEQVIQGNSRRLNAGELAAFNLSKAMMLRPTHWEVHYWFGRYQRLVKKNGRLANEHLKMSLELAPTRPDRLMIEQEMSTLNF